MDIAKLEDKIFELLDVPITNKEHAINTFKEKLANYLSVGEAVKFEGLGVFQLKEQLNQFGNKISNKESSDEGDLTLLFSPESDQPTDEALFLHLDINSKKKGDTDFDKNVFQLGIDKPLISIDDVENSTDVSNTDEVIRKVDKLIASSEKLKDFDLWDDYLKNKDASSMLENEEEEIEINLEDNLSDIENNEDPLYDNDVIELDENEIFEDLIDENKFMQDNELNNLSEDINIDDDLIEEAFDENKNDIIENNFPDVNELGQEKNNIEENLLDEEQVAEENTDIELDENKQSFDEIMKEENDDVGKDNIVEEEKAAEVPEKKINIAKPIVKLTDTEAVKYKISKKRKSPIIYLLFGAFAIVGAIGIYYLFFQNPTWMYDEHEMEVLLSQQHAMQVGKVNDNKILVDSTDSSKNVVKNIKELEAPISEEEIRKNNNDKSEAIINSVKKKSTLAQTNKKKANLNKRPIVTKQKQPEVKKNKVKETKTFKNIKKTNEGYVVQISSWKEKTVAEKEVNRIKKKGYPAFFVQVYIEKLNGTWYRVKAGPFSSSKEAQKAQANIK